MPHAFPSTKSSPQDSMTTLDIVNPIEIPNWNELLESNPQSSFFHTSNWAKVLHDTYGYEPLYAVLTENNELKALLPMMAVKRLLKGKKGVSLPFTDFCTPIADSTENFQKTFVLAEDAARKKSLKTIEIRGGDYFFREAEASDTFYRHVLNLNQKENDMFSSLKENIRRNIKKAEKQNLKIRFENTRESIQNFYRLNCLTRKQHGLPPQPFYFFKSFHAEVLMKGKGIVATAYQQNTPVSANIYLFHQGSAIYKYGASDKRHNPLRANFSLMWEAIKYFLLKNIKTLDFGRTDLHHTGLRRFKKGWGADEFYGKYYLYDVKAKTFKAQNKQLKTSYRVFEILPIPISKMIGRMCYRYVG